MAVSWLKQGAASAEAAKQAEVQAEIRKEEQNKMFRFFVKEGAETMVTFIDGALDPKEGVLVPPRYYEHNLFLNNKWGNFFVCPQETAPHLGEGCPICAGKSPPPSLVSLFTVIDHGEYQSKKDTSKVYKDTRKLFVAKAGTMEILQKIAAKRGGLAGATFDISRTGEKSPSVGTMFDFVKKTPIADLQKLYVTESVDPKTNIKMKKTYFVPADYEKEIVFRTAEELNKLGFGAPSVSGYGVTTSDTPPFDGGTPTDYSSQL